MLTRQTLNSFTLHAYHDLLAYFSRSHRFATFSEFAAPARNGALVLLRHDVDYSLAQALAMAQLEAQQGVRATYFLLFSAPLYNLLAPDSIAIPRQLVALGHEVGLHYDVAAIQRVGGNALRVLQAQAALLAELSGRPVTSIAMHNPSTSGADIFRDAPYVNAYGDRFVRDMAYYSDSCMAWRNSFIDAFEADAFPAQLQLLIHPCLWTDHEMTRAAKLDAIFSGATGDLLRERETARALWTTHAGVCEHDARERKVMYASAGTS